MRIFLFLPRLLIAASTACGMTASARTPVMEPDPTALAASRRLVAELRIDQSSWLGLDSKIAQNLSAGWKQSGGTAPKGIDREAFDQLLLARLRDEVRAAIPRMIPEVAERLANSYALRFSIVEIEAARSFYASDPGRRIAVNTVWDSEEIAALVENGVHWTVAGKLPEIVAESAEGVRLLGAVNRNRDRRPLSR